MRRLLAFHLAIVGVLAFCPSPAGAHLGSTKFLEVWLGDHGATISVAVEAVDASMELGLGEEVDAAGETRLLARGEEVARWLATGITLASEAGRCEATAGSPTLTARDARPYLELEIHYACPGVGPYELKDTTVFPDDAQHEAFIRVHHGPLGEDDASVESDARILRRGRQEAELGPPPSLAALAWLYLVEGAVHLATGYDHVLFLLSLVLAAGLVAVRESRKKAFKDVAIIVTAFTLGHSITLIAAALEWVVLPSQLVESVIALSIVVVAVLNIIAPKARGPMPWLAVSFGLVHGFGFSSVLAEQGLPSGQRALALFWFNVGIELAQLAFVALLLFPLAAAAKSERYESVVVRGGSALIALVAGYWFVTRAFG